MAVVFSCNTEPSYNPKDPSSTRSDAVSTVSDSLNDIVLVEGVLKFKNLTHLETVVKQLTNHQSSSELIKWESQFKGFTSMRSAFDNLSETDIKKISETESTKGYEDFLLLKPTGESDLEAVRVITSPVLATLFNKEGLVRFGNDAYKYTESKVYVIRDFTSSKLSDLSEINEVIKLEIFRTPIAPKAGGRPLYNNECNQYYGKNRLVGDMLLVSPLGSGPQIFSRIKAEAKSQKKVLGVWFANKIPWITLTVNGAYAQPNSGVTLSHQIHVPQQADVSKIENDFDFGGNATVHWMQVGAEGLCDDNNVRSCVTRYN